MPYLLNCLYGLALLLLSPWLVYRAIATGRYRRGLWAKLTGRVGLSPCPRVPASPRRRVWFHGVSVGEVHLLRQVVAAFRKQHPACECVISTTTETGYDEAHKHFPDCAVVFWPFDFSWTVRRALAEIQPRLVVLAEGEIWPNFLIAAQQQAIPVAVINARMSPTSLARYRLLGPLVRKRLQWVRLILAQNEDYAAAYRALGAAPDAVIVTGNVKYDGVSGERDNPRTTELRRLLGVQPNDLVWIAGSTQAPEEQIAMAIFARLKTIHPHLRLFIVPRHRERFDDVARLLEQSGLPWARRSQLPHPSPLTPHHSSLTPHPSPPVVLVDTMGELDALWGLADIAFVGGSLDGQRGGQNMIQPAAYGAAVLFGPHVWNFREATIRLLESHAAIQVADAGELEAAVDRLCTDADERRRLGEAARQLVRRQQGATARTVALLDRLLARVGGIDKAA
jgi:3-deoxy-D-manno-octulosonic-acid transferase